MSAPHEPTADLTFPVALVIALRDRAAASGIDVSILAGHLIRAGLWEMGSGRASDSRDAHAALDFVCAYIPVSYDTAATEEV